LFRGDLNLRVLEPLLRLQHQPDEFVIRGKAGDSGHD
jgi:hypothetical protein